MRTLTVIIPAYNEEKCIEKTLSDLFKSAKSDDIDLSLVVVDDGSQDATYDIVKKLAQDNSKISLVGHNTNRGFGKTVMTGIKHSSDENLLLVPADGQFDPGEMDIFLDALDEYDLAIGTRSSRSGYTLFRQFVSYLYINLVNIFFCQNYRDTNWVQAWKRKIFDKISPESTGVFFLQETITRANRMGYLIGQVNSIHLPRETGEAKGGNLDFIIFTFYEMMKFWWKLYIEHSI
ncbi:MAG: glycosyltransferase family 2 protein [Candidatus Eremiobacteraeota bacterium]|nr:glycosyltransferase family 2 protein [Candidatus Eremiobacteraeota bacterium]